MIDKTRRALTLGSLALPLGAWSIRAQAQDWPVRPIRMIVPLAPGGSADPMCRALSSGLGQLLGQTVIVENRPGAGGTTGVGEVARAAPDGYTFAYSLAGALTVAPHIASGIPYTLQDLTPVSEVVAVPEIVVANPRLGVRTLRELIDYAKAHPGRVNFGSAGNATVPHLGGELLKRVAGIDMVHVPYRGSGPALNDLLAGQVQVMVSDITLVRAHIKAGHLNGLAVAGPARVRELPDIPTAAEAGLPGMQVSNWHGIVAPAGLPAPILEKFHHAIRQATMLPDMKKRLDSEGAIAVASSPADFAVFLRQESTTWGGLVKQLGVKWE